jgi:hypothetical protein
MGAATFGPRHLDARFGWPFIDARTLVEFSDFQSADCGRAAPMARMLRELFPDRVRFVFRQYPSTRHPDAHLAAEASLAAHAQGKFWEHHDVLFANPHDLRRPALERYAAEIGLDLAAFRHALDARLFAEDVDADIALGHSVQASSRDSSRERARNRPERPELVVKTSPGRGRRYGSASQLLLLRRSRIL